MAEPFAVVWGGLAILAAIGMVWHASRFDRFRRRVQQYVGAGQNGLVLYAGRARVRAEAYRVALKAILLAVALARWTQAGGGDLAPAEWQDWVAMGGFVALLVVLTAWSLHTEIAERATEPLD